MARYALLLFDLDGTLLTPDREIHPENLKRLRRLMSAGVRVGLATGRPPRSLRRYAELLHPSGPVLCFNGCRALLADRVLTAHAVPLEVARAALEVAESLDVHANLYVDDEVYIEAVSEVSEESARKDALPQRPVGRLSAWLREAPTKILFITEPARVPALERALRERCPADTCELVRSEPDYLELLPAGVSKGAALDDALRALDLDAAEVIAFGDNLNDLELLERSGLGVAMENAHPDLKSIADHVIGPNDGASIARFLDRFAVVDGALVLNAPDIS